MGTYYRKALFVANAGIQISSEASSVDGFEIEGTTPTGTDTRVVFSLDGTEWQKLVVSGGVGTLTPVTTQTITAESVLSEGNTITDIDGVTSIPEFIGETVYIAVAFQADEEETVVPKLKIGIKQTMGADLYQKVDESAVYSISDDGTDLEVVSIMANTAATGAGTVNVEARFKTGGTWGAYMSVEAANKQKITASAFQLRATYNVVTIGEDSAQVMNATVVHRTNVVSNMTDGTAVCVTKTYDFGNTMTRAHLMVKHETVPDTRISAQISLRRAPTNVTGEILGVGDGTQKTVTLAHTEDLASHGFALYFDGKLQSSDLYSYSPNDGQVTFKANNGVVVSADYIYHWEDEHFVDFERDTSYQDKEHPNLVDEQFDYSATDPTDPVGSVGNVRVLLEQLSGTEENVSLGVGTGAAQAFKLDHHAKRDTITVSPATASWYYDDNNDILQVISSEGEAISVTYDWIGRSVSVDSIVCIFNE